MNGRILVILGHPRGDSLCGALAGAYEKGARSAGAEVRRINVAELEFDALGTQGENMAPDPEPDILATQEAIRWAKHLVFVYPIWWGTMPALLKAFLERCLTRGFAIEFPDRPPYWEPMLQGRSARLINTMNTPPLYYRWVMRAPDRQVMQRSILGMCGISPVAITSFGPVRGATAGKLEEWLAQTRRLGEQLR
jgi:putative NADPH-quinone reductase